MKDKNDINDLLNDMNKRAKNSTRLLIIAFILQVLACTAFVIHVAINQP